jgi:PAS domain S-box-containing protein
MGRPLRVLIIEDSEDDTQLLLRELRRDGYEVESERVETAEAMQSALTQKNWDLILSDYSLPGFGGLQALEVLKARGQDLPFILISGTIGEETAVSALKAGANDFLIKGKFARLGPAIDREVREAESRRERKQAGDALRESEARYRLAARATNDVIWEWDPKTNELMWSENAQTVFGYIPEEIKAEAAWWDEHIHPEDHERVVNDINAFRESGGMIWADEYRFLRRDGSIAYIVDRAYVERDADGKPVRMIGAMSDITERKRAEEALRESEGKIQNIIRHSSSMFYARTADHVLTYVSPQSRDILDCEPEEAMVHWQEFLSDNPSNRQGIEAAEHAIETGWHQPPYELELITRNGRKIWVQVDESPVVKDAKTIAIVGSLTNITERKRAEEEIKKQLDELQRWHNATLGRETRVLDLKREVNELLGQTGKPPRYPSAET